MSAQHPTNAEIQTILGKTVSALKPYELRCLATALDRTNHVEGPPDAAGAAEATLATIFPAGDQQW